MARAARFNPPRSVLQSPPQRTAIFHAAYRNLPHSIQQSPHNVLQFFDTVSLSVSERSFKKRDPSLWTSPEKFVVLGDQT